MQAIQAVIFDMDGVLLDSEPLHLEAMRRILAAEGLAIDEAEYRGYIGATSEETWRAVGARRGIAATAVPDYLARYYAKVVEVVAEQAVPMPGLLPLLADLHAAGVQIGVGSTSPSRWITASLDAIGVSGYFGACVGGDQVERHKPAPDVFLRAAELLGVDPAACVVIEDSLRGIQAAHAGGMFAVALQVPGAMVHSTIPPEAADLSVTSLAAFHVWWQARGRGPGIGDQPT